MSRDQEKAMFAKNYKPSGKTQRIYMPTYMNPKVKSPTKLMTQQMRKDIPPLYSQDGKDPEDVTVHAHYFTPFSSWDWYITEYDGKDTMFGLVKRDLYWTKKSLAEVRGDVTKNEPVTIDFSLYKQSGKWHYYITKDGKQTASASNFNTEKEAKIAMEKKLDEITESTKKKQNS